LQIEFSARQHRQTALQMDRSTLFIRYESCQTHHSLRLNDFTEASLDLSTMSSAQLDIHPLDEATPQMEAAPSFALKEQVAERLAAHRARRTQGSGNIVTPIAPPAPAKARSARIAAAVAERYAQSQTYRAFLAEEAEKAIRQAEAAAEVAARSAQAIADAQYQLLAELDEWALTPPPTLPVAAPDPLPSSSKSIEPVYAAPIQQSPGSSLTVTFYDDVALSPTEPTAILHPRRTYEPLDEAEGIALDEEIAFRQAPVFDELAGPPTDIPANLIEFPRQLIAARKARPRLAEGPLREEADLAPDAAQLRIFEVEAAQISTAPAVESAEPVWSSILLGALPATAPVESLEAPFNPAPAPQAASLNLRLMASAVDICLILASFLTFAAAFAFTIGKLSSGNGNQNITIQTAIISTLSILAFLAVLYHMLFFTFAEATPGMRYARIALCTLSDENPTRSAMRRRLFAMLLSACPLGIGFLWACLDEDGLGWHDRISRMYQRSY
jgi:uncharacterized RDD family membrane protein YckC